ncbi:MAG: exo-alpha-sialidase, partial [Lachnospiraceae bacterium]|nr:exo-alpha-sialidase [Lachnospiraceae bacterium]
MYYTLGRTRNGQLAVTYSKDNGDTWSKVQLSELPNNNSGTDAVTIADGRHVIAYNDSKSLPGQSGGPRTPLCLAISEDGKHWNKLLTLEDNNIGEYSYPSIIQGRNGNLYIVYTWRRQRIVFKEIALREILFATLSSDTIPYRIPAIASTSDGDILALADYRYCKSDIGFGRIDIHARLSSDYGKTWGKEFLVTRGSGVHGAVDCGFGDAALVADRESNEVLLVTVCGETVYTAQTTTRQNPNRVALLRSHDNGKTWSKFKEITESIYSLFDKSTIGPVQSLFFGSGRIFQSRKVKVGSHYRIYAALCARPNGNRVIYSDDFGNTWTDKKILIHDDNYNLCESSSVLIDNKMIVLMRENSNKGIDGLKIISNDYGASWSKIYNMPIPACHRPVITHLKEGYYLITYRFNQGIFYGKGHHGQNIMGCLIKENDMLEVDRDKIESRIFPIDYDRNINSNCGYTGCVQFSDGMIYVVSF